MRQWTRWTTAVCAAAAIVAAIAVVQFREPHPLRGLHLDPHIAEARVTALGETRWAPSSSWNLIGEVWGWIAEEAPAEDLQRLGALALANGRARAARDSFLEAARLQPGDADILSDLAAAQLALGDVAEAAENAGRALDRDPSNASAAFNRAIALERLSVRPVAIRAWERYLELDSDSEWADAARNHHQSLSIAPPSYSTAKEVLRPGADPAAVERVVRQFPQRTRGLAQNYLLPEWMESHEPAKLALIRDIARARASLGDPYLLDIVEHAAAHPDAMREPLAEFTAARAEEEKARWDRAAERFARASALLEQVGSPLFIGAAIYAAQGEWTAGRRDAALSRLREVDEALAAREGRYPTMAAESAWIQAMIAGRSGEPQESLEAYRRALANAQRGGEIEHVAAITALLAWTLETVGDPDEADAYRLEALRRNEEIHAAPERMFTSYQDTAYVALRSGRPHVALAFVEAMAPIARESGLPQRTAQTHALRALGLLELGRREQASTNLATARAYAMQIELDAARDSTLANIDFTEGRLEEARPERAALHYASAVEIWDRYGWRAHTAAGRLALGEAQMRCGRTADAEREFRAGIEEMEAQRSTLDEPAVRIAYFERSDRIFDRLIALLLREGRAVEALSVVDRKRARLLLDAIGEQSGKVPVPLRGEEIVSAVDGSTALLEIALLDDSVEMWLVRNGRAVHSSIRTSRPELEELARKHVVSIASGDAAAVQRSGRALYDRLIAPVQAGLAGDPDLVIVPDAALQSFPFATLVTTSGRFLIEEHAVAVAPSASVFLRAPRAVAHESLLAVAQPAPAGFARLPSVVREAEEIARGHPRSRVVVGADMTGSEFLSAAGAVDIVHFAGHATASEDEPAASGLVFESADGAAARLGVRDIARSRLQAHPLVVLAACSTGRGKLRRTEGIDSVASAFLQAGARAVTATLWDIDDETSLRLFRSFHASLRAGRSPSRALREAQRSLLHSNDPRDRDPAVWGSVTLVGGL